MHKIYKKLIVFDALDPDTKDPAIKPKWRFSSLLNLPIALVAGLVSVVFFSAIFTLLLIPIGIISYKAWRLFRNKQAIYPQQTIEAEYTVLKNDEPEK
jgi:hypothetical protein